LIYGTTPVLDHFASGWKALIQGDYEAVMPLTWRKKFGISYLFQPAFLQQLGVFGDTSRVHDFLESARSLFRFGEINLNFSNLDGACKAKSNYTLAMSEPYDPISSGYTALHKKNLKRAFNAGLNYKNTSEIAKNVTLSYRLYGNRITGVGSADYEKIAGYAAKYSDSVIAREVWSEDELQASCVCLKDHRRIYFVISSVTDKGRKNQANHFLVDNLVREYSGSGLTLDFEGSDLPGVAAFYQGFGAVDQPYCFHRWNSLPLLIKWLKG
jgi:hypothetical protein